MTDERVIHLALSQKAGKVLQRMIEQMDGYLDSEEEAAIADAIYDDLKVQIESPKKKTKRRPKK